MSIKQQIDADLKTAMLAGEKTLVTTLRGLKSAILYVEVAEGARDQGLPEEKVIAILQKEAKKRQESADLFKQGGNDEKHQAELTEKTVIEKYLPEAMSEEDIAKLVDDEIAATGASGMQSMGQVIGAVKAKAGSSADGSVIARIVKEKLQ
jgi:uncharacterized protein YqeY